jgi:hypothetical protein
MAVWRRPGPLWQSGPGVPSGVMVCLRVLARTGRAGGRRSYASFPPSPGSIAMSTLCVARWRGARDLFEWLCTQERWNLEVAIMFGTAARYRRATVGSSYDDAHPDNPTLHTGAVCPHLGFVESLFFISSRTGHGHPQMLKMLPAFSCISWACAFRAGDGASIFFGGLVGADRRHSCPASTSWPFGISWCTLSLVKKTLHRHSAGFEPQRASSCGKRMKAPHLLGYCAVRA